MSSSDYLTVDPDAVHKRVTEALERFEAESDWEFSLTGSDSLSRLDVAKSLPKRGPAHMLSRIAVQSAKDSLPFAH